MSKIRKLYYFDRKKTLEMVSFLNNRSGDNYLCEVMFNPFLIFHYLLPLRFKYLPESYVLQNKKNLKGLITVAPTKSVQKKVEIKKLFFEENSYEDAYDLVQYAVSKYKAMGATSVIVKVDDYLPELITIFVSRCGFSQISYEKLWRITEFPNAQYDKKNYRYFRNSDSQTIANINNDSVLPHFRPLLSTDAGEYKDFLFSGLNYYSEYKYTIIDKKTKNVTGCVVIKSYDNENYIVDIIQNEWASIDVNSILSFATDKIKHRHKKFGLFVKSKRYTNIGERYEKIFMENGYECVQNQLVLTNSSAKVLKANTKTGKFTAIGDFYPSNVISA